MTNYDMKKLKHSKPKKINKTAQTRRLDILFSKAIRSIGFCQAEGKLIDGKLIRCGGQLQCAHITTRSNRRLRWDTMNALSLCAGHHRWWTTHPLEWVEFLIKYYDEKYLYILAHRNEINDETHAETLERLKKL